jgi:hypothetical protein
VISLVFDAARRALGQPAGELAAGIGVVAVLLAIFVAVERELLRSSRSAVSKARVRATDPIIYPLLLAFAFILGARLGQFI